MGLFNSIYRAVSPKILVQRQRMFIEALKALDPNFRVIVISDEEVMLDLPKSDEGEKIIITLHQDYNSTNSNIRKTLYLSYASTVEGESMKVDLNFEDPTASAIMIKTLIVAVRNETKRIIATKEHEKDSPEEKRNLQINKEDSYYSGDTDSTQEFLNSSSLYNGENKCDINLLTIEQKIALFTLLTLLAKTAALDGDKDDIANTIRYFGRTIHLYEENVDKKYFDQITSNKKKCIEIVKTIHFDGPLIEFATACGFLKNENDSNPMFSYECIHTFMDIGFSKEEAEDMYKGKYHYKFE